jgi:hypothetical protein
MILTSPPGTMAVLLLASGTMSTMTDDPRALSLDVQQRDGAIEVQLIGLSERTLEVTYTLEMTGNSTSRHRGKTTLTAGSRAVLSSMRASANENWCVKLVAKEAGDAPYELIKGNCPTS